ncbi:MAG: Gfo/Idh/MocA family oxidoreductase [Ferruginibacter sp.]
MGKHYRWGILGAGRIAEKFCTALAFVEGSSIYAVASRDIQKAQAYGARFKAEKVYDNYTALVNDKDVDIIYIATPHVFHYDQAMLCLQNKKAVLCEKPMSMNYAQSAGMIAFAKQHNIFLMEGMWSACMPFMDKIKSLIAEDFIGEPRYVTADFGFEAPKDLDGRLYNKALGGGSVLDIGVYPISLATLILGEPSAIRAISSLTVTGVDEYANVIMQYANGATSHVLSTIHFNTPIEAEIIGTKGSLKIESPWFKATDISLHGHDGSVEKFSLPHYCNGFEHEIKEVMYCLDNGLLQSEKVPHGLTLSVSRIMDEVLQQAGVRYS